MRFLLLALLTLLLTPLAGQVTVSVHQSTTSLRIEEQFTVEYTISYPSSYRPDLFAFFSQIEPPTALRILSSKTETTPKGGDKELQIIFTLAPTATGTSIFAPGPLSFGTAYSTLLPAVEIDCVPTAVTSLMLAPLLPFRAETKILLNPENRALIQSSKKLLEEQGKNVASFTRYEEAWNLLSALLLSLAGGTILLWCAIEYNLWHKVVAIVTPREDPVVSLQRQLQNKELTLDKRWHLLSLLVRATLSKKEKRDCMHMTSPELLAYITASNLLLEEEKRKLTRLVERLDLLCFGNGPTSEAEWQEMHSNFVQ